MPFWHAGLSCRSHLQRQLRHTATQSAPHAAPPWTRMASCQLWLDLGSRRRPLTVPEAGSVAAPSRHMPQPSLGRRAAPQPPQAQSACLLLDGQGDRAAQLPLHRWPCCRLLHPTAGRPGCAGPGCRPSPPCSSSRAAQQHLHSRIHISRFTTGSTLMCTHVGAASEIWQPPGS
jgi:hypothetical protein